MIDESETLQQNSEGQQIAVTPVESSAPIVVAPTASEPEPAAAITAPVAATTHPLDTKAIALRAAIEHANGRAEHSTGKTVVEIAEQFYQWLIKEVERVA